MLYFIDILDNLALLGYKPVKYTPGLWKHDTRLAMLNLCVDDFCIKYHTKEDLKNSLNALASKYEISIDYIEARCIGLTIDWHYDDGYVDVYMSGHVMKVL